MPKPHVTPEHRPTESLGARLRDTRTQQGKSLPEASQATCISLTTLTALEADDFTKLPAEVFTRGFIKIYADHLGLDSEETLKLYIHQEKLDPKGPAARPYRRDVLSGTSMARPGNLLKDNPRVRMVAILLAALLTFYVLGALLKMGQKPAGQTTPETDLAKSLVDSNTPPLPPRPGEPPPSVLLGQQGGIPGGTAVTAASPANAQPAGAGGAPVNPAPAAETSSPQTAQPQGETGGGAAR